MTQTLHIRDIVNKRSLEPLSVLFLEPVLSRAWQVKAGETPREELVRYVQDLVHDNDTALHLADLLDRIMVLSDGEFEEFDPDDKKRLVETQVLPGGSLTWDESLADVGLNANVAFSPSETVDDLIEALTMVLTDDSYPVMHEIVTASRPLIDSIERMMEKHFITSQGRIDHSEINHVIDQLEARDHTVTHRVLEEDSFGPLLCGLKTRKGTIAYG